MSHKLTCPYCKQVIISGKNILRGDIEYFEHLKNCHPKAYQEILDAPDFLTYFGLKNKQKILNCLKNLK